MNMALLRRLTICFVLAASTLSAAAEATDSLNIVQQIEAPGNISVTIPDGLLKRLESCQPVSLPTEGDDAEKAITETKRNTSRVGYRVQVFDDNNVRTAKHEAQNRKRQIQNRFPEFGVYMQFNSPYWRVKVGDFRTRSEADAALAAIRAAFPSIGNQMRVVRDHINANH